MRGESAARGPRSGKFPLARTQILFIERLIDPDESSLPDWGEDVRVIVYRVPPASVLPANMPNLLRAADAVLVNTMDCPPGKGIDEKAIAAVRQANHDAAVFGLHRPAQDNLTPWVGWLRQRIRLLLSGQARGAEISG
jgi:Ni2+-binding GTPase involved in maturation of urease and hydrogenase